MAIDPTTWRILDYICRACARRILASVDGDRCRCAECGLTAAGDHTEICFCGALPPGSRVALRCVRNEHRSAEFPSEIVAVEAAAEAAAVRRVAGAA